MLGAVQLGVLAAFVVLLVPMGMAGWHLSRNKMLFFSGALFITLAVCVHLTPYFPTISAFVSSISSSSNPIVTNDNNKNRQSCISHLHDVVFNVDSGNEISSEGSWSWVSSDSVNACEFQKLGPSDSSDLLNGSWVVVAGDSQARLLAVSLLGLVMGKDEMGSVRGDLFKRHSDYHTLVDEIGLKLDFIWAPYVENLTGLVTGLKKNRNYPDVLVMGAGLWHMLHVSDPSDYGFSLRELRKSVVSLLLISHETGADGTTTGYAPIRSPHVFWLGMPVLINSMLNTEEKKEKMQDSLRSAYEGEIYASKLLRRSRGPLLMLDIESLSKRCGKRCTADGMHYDGIVYEAAVHILLNALLIESHQRL